MKLNKTAAFIIFIILCIGLWNLFDFLTATFITKSVYVFNFQSGVLYPGLISAMVGMFTFLRGDK